MDRNNRRAHTGAMTRTSLPLRPPPAAPVRTEVSRHPTSSGTVVWSRCTCGRLQALLSPDVPTAGPLVAGGRTPGCPDCL